MNKEEAKQLVEKYDPSNDVKVKNILSAVKERSSDGFEYAVVDDNISYKAKDYLRGIYHFTISEVIGNKLRISWE